MKQLGMSILFKKGNEFHNGTFLKLVSPITMTTIKYALKEYLIEYELTNLSPKNVDEMVIAITDGEDINEYLIDPCDVWPTRECLESDDPFIEL